jgi:hypothetical protein
MRSPFSCELIWNVVSVEYFSIWPDGRSACQLGCKDNAQISVISLVPWAIPLFQSNPGFGYRCGCCRIAAH